MSSFFQRSLPTVIAIVAFLVASFAYFLPVTKGLKVQQSDIVHFQGMSKEIKDYREATGEEPLWTNRMFGGMPAFMISTQYSANLVQGLYRTINRTFPPPVSNIVFYLQRFYIMLRVMRVDPWLSIVGAFAFALSTYHFLIIEAGHNTKAMAIGLMAPVFSGIVLAYRGKYLLGMAVTALFLGMQISVNHLQITYYLAIAILLYGLVELVKAIMGKALPQFTKASLALLLAAVMALGCNISRLWTTYEYTEYSTRGPSELSASPRSKTAGLSPDYITAWSYGVGETFTMMVPGFKGGGSERIADGYEDALKTIDSRERQSVGSMTSYFGAQPFTSGPSYVGALVVFLFVLSLFLVRSSLKWWVLGTTVLFLLLSWGKHFMGFTQFFIDHFPLYSKFRSVSTALVIPEMLIPLLAILGVDQLLKQRQDIKQNMRPFYISLGVTGGLCLLFYLVPDMFNSFEKEGEAQQIVAQLTASGNPEAQVRPYVNQLLIGAAEVREAIFQASSLRSLAFILLGGALVWLFVRGTVNRTVLLGGLGLLIVLDLWMVDKHYLNEGNFVKAREIKNPFPMTEADRQILADTDPYYRVFNVTVRLDQDSRTAFYHNTLGGYHAAKPGRYQELIDRYLSARHFPVINMLNAKYFILPNQQGGGVTAQRNPGALGNAWFVSEYQVVADADAEMEALGTFDPAKTALVDARFQDLLPPQQPQQDAAGSIRLTEYKPNHLTFASSCQTDQLAVFADMYYEKGWKAFVDGAEVPHFRTNYILRGMQVPAGEHVIEFRFDPASYRNGERLSLIISALVLGGLAFLLYLEFRSSPAKEAEEGA
ncbi:MAG: hypothetical protein AAGB22_00410 [Bacteroidota bacterium]